MVFLIGPCLVVHGTEAAVAGHHLKTNTRWISSSMRQRGWHGMRKQELDHRPKPPHHRKSIYDI